jgi:hypothetical protein
MDRSIVDTIKGIFAFLMSLWRKSADEAASTIIEGVPPVTKESATVIEPVSVIAGNIPAVTKEPTAVAEPAPVIAERAPAATKGQAAVTVPVSGKARRALTVRRNRDRRILDDWKLVRDVMGYTPFTPSQYHAALRNAGVGISIAAMYVHLDNLRKRRYVALHLQRPIMYRKRGTPPKAVVPVDTKQGTSPIG